MLGHNPDGLVTQVPMFGEVSVDLAVAENDGRTDAAVERPERGFQRPS
jgi:hypothetical protein